MTVMVISSYLASIIELEYLFQPTKIDNLDIIPAGAIPPNPAELLLNDRMKYLIQSAQKKYDYVILDTPPVGLVSDALGIMKYSDLNIFVVRQNYSLKSSLAGI